MNLSWTFHPWLCTNNELYAISHNNDMLTSCYTWPSGPFHERFFHRDWNSMEISFRSHLSVVKWSLRNVAHGTTAVLSWHVQNFWNVTIHHHGVTLEPIFIYFEIRLENCSWNGPQHIVVLHYRTVAIPRHALYPAKQNITQGWY